MKKLLISITLLALLVPAAFAQDITNDEILKYLVGTWEGSYEWENMGTFTEHVEYSWSEDGSHIVMNMKIMQGDQQLDTSTGWLKVDPEKNTILMEATSQATGNVVNGFETKREGTVVWSEGEGGMVMPKYKAKMDLANPDELHMVWYVPEGEGWKELISVTYTRSK